MYKIGFTKILNFLEGAYHFNGSFRKRVGGEDWWGKWKYFREGGQWREEAMRRIWKYEEMLVEIEGVKDEEGEGLDEARG